MDKQCLGCMELYEDQFDICPHCGYVEGAKAEESIHMNPGTLLVNRYIIGKVLGYGGFGVTYIAWDKLLEQKVAIKEYLPGEFSTRMPGESAITIFSGDRNEQFTEGLNKFVEEAKRLSKFQNEQGIVKIFDSFRANDTAYIVMEYLDGETLETYLQREGQVSEDKAMEMLLPVLNSLQVVHKEGILHRDIAPENIFITKDGDVKLIDFGASRYATTSHSRSLTVIIKPGYSPEEQYRSRGDQGPHTDIYALASTMYKMVTGITPPDALERRALIETKKKDLLKDIHKVNKEVSRNVENAILNAMNVQIEDRTPDIASFVSELNSQIPVRRRRGKIKKIDMYAWPLWLKVVVPACFSAFLITGILMMTGAIKFESLFSDEVMVPEGMAIVPEVEGTTTEIALEELNKMNLTPSPEGNIESEYVEAGIIVLQSPNGGSYLEKYGKVVLTVSSGKGVIEAVDGISTVPYVIWDTKEAAIEKLKAAGLAEPIIEMAYDDNVAEGKVISQSQSAGTKLDEGTQITITVSLGAKPFAMLNVVGQTKKEAEEILLSKGLEVYFEYVSDDSVAENTVVGQDVSEGTNVKKGTKVTLRISSKKEVVKVADVVGKTKSDASARLKNQGFTVTVVENYDANVAKGNVISQTPAAGTSQIKGSSVTIVVSKGVPTVVVPNVVGNTEASAKAALVESKLNVNVVYKEDGKVAAGKVISQTPTASTTQSQGTTVTIYVSTGVQLIAVPNVVGQTQTNAVSTLQHVGLTVNTTEEFSSTVEQGKVISQTIKEGEKVSRGTKIELVISLGAHVATPENYFTISVSNGKAKITDFPENYEGALIIPQTIRGYPVTVIGENAFSSHDKITSVVIPEGVTDIEWGAFRWCHNLENISFPSSLKSIGYSTFLWCESLNNITLPSNLTYIGDGAFSICRAFTKIEIPDSVVTIGARAFEACDSLKSVKIGSGVKYFGAVEEHGLGGRVFNGCSSLQEVTLDSNNKYYHMAGNCIIETQTKKLVEGFWNSVIPNDGSVTIIGAHAFDSVSHDRMSIEPMYINGIPEGITEIEEYAFNSCEFKELALPSTLTYIGERAFYGARGVSNLVIPNRVKTIGKFAFGNCDFKTLSIPDSVTTIGDNAFGYGKLETVYFSSQTQKDKFAYLFDSSVKLIVQ